MNLDQRKLIKNIHLVRNTIVKRGQKPMGGNPIMDFEGKEDILNI